MKKKLTKITELVISDDNEELSIDAISLVTSPAIEVDFVFFGKDKHNLTFSKIDEEKRMLISPALIPNKQIFRYNPNTDSEYYVYFSTDTVRKASELYLKYNNHHKATYQHQDRVAGVLTVESWIKEGDQDKSKMYGYDLPNGTWFVKMKIENNDLWEKIKAGELKGLSIEGYFVDKMEKMSKTVTDEEIVEAYNDLVKEGKINKVELGLADDLKKLNTEAEKISKIVSQDSIELSKLFQKLKNDSDDFNKINDRRKNNIKKGKSIFKELNTLLDKTQKQAKELGITPRDIPNFSKSSTLSNDLRASINDLQKYSDINI
tara:strand:- start:158 stop:1114 length:957 start_codon:yes stop_codon:yes gene_type:complete